jgi:putative peptidoglycan lipid II flippase
VFLLGLPAHALNVILARAFYSGKDTVTPVSVAIASVGINVVISLLTVERLGLAGLASGIAVGAWFEATTLTLLLARRHGTVGLEPIVSGGVVSLVGAAISALAAAAVLGLTPTLGDAVFLGLALSLTVASGAALVVYLAYSRLVRLPELPRTLGLLRAAFRPG